MKRLIACLALVVVLLAGPPIAGLGVVPASAASLTETRREFQDLLARLTLHRKRLRQVRQQERRVLGELEGIDRTKEEAEQRLNDLSVDLKQSTVRTQAVATQLSTTQRQLAARRQRLAVRVREIYKYGRASYLDVLLGGEDFAEFISRWHLVSTVVGTDADAIATYTETMERYQQLHTNLLTEQANIKRIATQTDVRRREILAQEQAKRAMLRKLQTERAAYERVVRELEQNSRDIEVMIRRMQSSSAGPRIALARGLGGFIWPARGVFTSGFGVRRHPIFGIRRMHTGVDISASWGSPVAVAADGRVIYTGWFGGYGKIVVIDHGGGISTLYAHLSRILVATGATVRKGEIIGRAGSTGYSTGPHVHFEIRINGRPVNPVRP